MDAADTILMAVHLDAVDLFQTSELIAALGRR